MATSSPSLVHAALVKTGAFVLSSNPGAAWLVKIDEAVEDARRRVRRYLESEFGAQTGGRASHLGVWS